MKAIKMILMSMLLLHFLFSTQNLLCQLRYKALKVVEFNDEQKKIMEEGIKYHDYKDYDRAIQNYREVIKLNPDNPTAYYEIGFSFFSKNECDSVIKYSEIGMKYDSEVFPLIAMSMANCLDISGKSEQAVQLYKDAIKLVPDLGILYYNLGLTYINQNKHDDAFECFKKSAWLFPVHPSTQYSILREFYNDHLYVPTLLSACRYLLLEPDTERSIKALEMLNETMGTGVTSKTNKSGKKTININISPKSLDSNNTWGATELMMKMSGASKSDEPLTIFNKKKEFLSSLFQFVSNQSGISSNKNDFSYRYYQNFFAEIAKKGYSDAAVHLILYKELDENELKWMVRNSDKMDDFRKWLEKFSWPKEM